MKIKTIENCIRTKINAWLKTIEDPLLRDLLKDEVIVTGGCITSMLLGEPVNDYDVYFTDSDIVKSVLEYYKPKFDDWGASDKILEIDGSWAYYIKSRGMLKNDAHKPDEGTFHAFIATANAVTLRDKIQLITRFCGSPEQIHENFDFLHCRNYWTAKEGLVLDKDALAMTLTKELRYVGSKFPLCSIIRTKKFINRDWTVNAGQYLKMAMQLNALDLLDLKVLEDQLTGVDTAYFVMILEELSKAQETGNKPYDLNDIMGLIDKIFDMALRSSL